MNNLTSSSWGNKAPAADTQPYYSGFYDPSQAHIIRGVIRENEISSDHQAR